MAIYLGTRSVKDLFVHFMLVVGLVAAAFLLFFFVYLPWTTNHGQSITVPDIRKMSMDDAERLLRDRNLSYVVSDCTFVSGMSPHTVLSQYPFSNSLVKEGRRIFLTVTTMMAPPIRMPDLITTNLSLRSAETLLRNVGLQIGSTRYVPHVAENAVVEQLYNGTRIQPGTLIPKGSKIDLLVGNGIGNTEMDIPSLVGKSLDEAEITIRGSDLIRGTLIYEYVPGTAPGTVLRQRPEPGGKIRVGEIIDLWVAGAATDDDAEPAPAQENRP